MLAISKFGPQRTSAWHYFVAVLLTTVVALLLFAAGPVHKASADAPALKGRNGISVQGWRWISNRTLEYDISTSFIHPDAVAGRHRIRVTLPTGYLSTSRRYSVLYLLHGGAGANSSQWTTTGGAAEAIVGSRPLIVVSPDGGKVGWYTSWLNPGSRPQKWWHHFIEQVIPFIDGNLRTNAFKNGRAIAGLSMGGFGAIRFAQDRPDLFRSASSFSGALNLEDAGIRSVVTEQATQYGFPADGPFGSPFWPGDAGWNNQNPLRKAARLKGVQVNLYAGSGIHDQDVLERQVGWSTHQMNEALKAAKVPAFYWMYGRNVKVGGWNCNGGHNFGCWNGALSHALPKIMSVLQN